jgi:hypothetical protein
MLIAAGFIVCILAGAGVFYATKARGRLSAGGHGATAVPGVVAEPSALVTTPISARAAGGITYSVAGERRDIAARSVDGGSIEAGTTVTIERIEGAMAFVSVSP